MPTFSDEHIEYWGNKYDIHRESLGNITIEQFLADPHRAMQRVNIVNAVIDELIDIRNEMAIENHGDQAVQPIRPRANPKTWKVGRKDHRSIPVVTPRPGGFNHA